MERVPARGEGAPTRRTGQIPETCVLELPDSCTSLVLVLRRTSPCLNDGGIPVSIHGPELLALKGLNRKARGWHRGAQRRGVSPGSGSPQIPRPEGAESGCRKPFVSQISIIGSALAVFAKRIHWVWNDAFRW
jgi:hypothetical protein